MTEDNASSTSRQSEETVTETKFFLERAHQDVQMAQHLLERAETSVRFWQRRIDELNRTIATTFVTKIHVENGGTLLPLPTKIMQQMNWSDGDTVICEIRDGEIYIKKA